MKKIILTTITLLLVVVAVQAVPAHPGTARVQQPDGSYITLRLVGDEWLNFNTTVDGYSVVKNSRGYYVYAEKKDGRLMPTARIAHDIADRSADELAFLAGVKKYQAPQMDATLASIKDQVDEVGVQRRAQRRATDYDKFKGLIVLIEFKDKEFSREDYKDLLGDMVNKEGYTGYDGQKMPGSVRDYFSDNSDGKFKPQFDIVGPYTVDYSQYECSYGGGKCAEILLAAIDSADVDVNYKDYDGDGDNRVDLVYFVVAGNGANYSGNDGNLWWPHRSIIYNPKSQRDWQVMRDGVMIYDYASSTELAGYTAQPKSIFIDGIGTICHEFSHVLGLPDFYDANYEEDGQSVTPDVWSVMDAGCYLNNGFTPCGYSLYERWSVNFTGDPQTIEGEGVYDLKPLHTSKTGYRIDTPEREEFFLLENRQNGQFKWDAYLPASGMLVHRVDLSSSRVWQGNMVNNNPERNYYELIRALGNTSNAANDVFPGRSKVDSLHNSTSPANLKSWSGKATQWGLFKIKMDARGDINFEVHDAKTLKALALPETAEVGVSVSVLLSAILTPDYADAVLEWSSSNTAVATVDENGLVTGVGEGACVITVKSNNGMTATCKVTVKAVPLYDIAEFKALADGSEELLQFVDAQVLFAGTKTAFVRDASGAIILEGFEGLRGNDVINGAILVQLGQKDGLPQASLTDNSIVDALSVESGSQVEYRGVALEDLGNADYCDLVMVKAAKLVSKKVDGKAGVYLESGDRSIRFFNSLKNLGFNKTVPMPKNYVDKYYDVPALYATFVDGGTTADAIYLMDSLTEVEAPTGIVEVRQDAADGDQRVYNLHGQRVSPTTKGLVVKNGKIVVNR